MDIEKRKHPSTKGYERERTGVRYVWRRDLHEDDAAMEARPPTAATIRAPPPLPPEKRHKDAPDISHTVGRQVKQPHTQHTSTTKATAVHSRSARR